MTSFQVYDQYLETHSVRTELDIPCVFGKLGEINVYFAVPFYTALFYALLSECLWAGMLRVCPHYSSIMISELALNFWDTFIRSHCLDHTPTCNVDIPWDSASHIQKYYKRSWKPTVLRFMANAFVSIRVYLNKVSEA